MRRLAMVVLAIICGSGPTFAAVIQVRPKFVAALKPDFTPVEPDAVADFDPLTYVRLKPSGEKYILQFDFLMTIESLTEGQVGFGNTLFHINLTGVTQNADLPGWIPDGWRPIDIVGDRPGRMFPKWAGNMDAGPFAGDLQYILLETAPKSFYSGNPPGSDTTSDPRRTLGIAPYHNPSMDALGNAIAPHTEGEYASSLFVEVDGTAGNRGVVNTTVIGGSTYNADLLLSTAGSVGGPPIDFEIRVAPEPSALALFGLGSSALFFTWKRRRLRLAANGRRGEAPSQSIDFA